jgi:hypothetical protein
VSETFTVVKRKDAQTEYIDEKELEKVINIIRLLYSYDN